MSKSAFCIPVVRNRLLGIELASVLPMETKTSFLSKLIFKVNKLASVMAISLAIIVGISYFAPQIYYNVFSSNQVFIEVKGERSVLGGDFDQGTESKKVMEVVNRIPPKNENLPEGNWIAISRIGVRTKLIKTEDPYEALNEGVWQVPDYGDPGSKNQPMILAAHRFGWQWMWDSAIEGESYALRNIFYKLPETEPGDIVEIISDQRRYVYEIYSGEENSEITDYDADLILYTCKFINSPARLIRYARLLDLNQDTQEI
ncbi:MAG: sortase [Patescibacteria group bacterium]